MLPRVERRVITYGFSESADVSGHHATTDGHASRCQVRYAIRGVPGGAGEGAIELNVPGLHNLQNALAAVAVGLELGVPFGRIARALNGFRGAERRYETRGSAKGVTVVDDYGHHPTELAAVLRAARAGKPSRIIAIFQPHRYTRTRDLLAEFGPALSLADVVVLTDIYAAGEAPIPGVTLEALAGAIRASVPDVRVVPEISDIPAAIRSMSRDGDLVLTLGAGSIGTVGDRVVAALQGVAS
jgi:UDP-N-acetylmuramate--alanine ligase